MEGHESSKVLVMLNAKRTYLAERVSMATVPRCETVFGTQFHFIAHLKVMPYTIYFQNENPHIFDDWLHKHIIFAKPASRLRRTRIAEVVSRVYASS